MNAKEAFTLAKQNSVYLYGRVHKTPMISKNEETEEYNYGMVYLDVVRGLRYVGDHLKKVKHDYPLIMSREPEILDEISTWQENDIVLVKGVITTKSANKGSYCPHCTDESGNATKNVAVGNLLYVTPIYVRKEKSYQSVNEAVEDVVKNREISNQIICYGTLVADPRLFRTKSHVNVAQYPLALNRKFTIRTDDPNIKTDWPIVKSYGDQAILDKMHLAFKSEVLIDGFLQARKITRHATCSCCGQMYDWKDNCMEIVPYAVEYMKGEKSDDDVRVEYGTDDIEAIKTQLYDKLVAKDKDTSNSDDELKSDDLE